MKVGLIGSGSSGSALALEISKMKGIERLVIADKDIDSVRSLSKKIKGNIETECYEIDATEQNDAEKIAEKSDIIINTASPICNIPIMKACIARRSNYIDLASDPFEYPDREAKTSINHQLKLDQKFSNNNLLAITNAGASPGFSDILFNYASKTCSLKSVDNVKIYFSETVKSEKLISSWSPYTLLLESILPPTVYEDGEIKQMNFEERKRTIRFPTPLGKTRVLLLNGHPELRTIPEFTEVPIKYLEVGGGLELNGKFLDEIILETLSRQSSESPIFRGEIFKILSQSFEPVNKFIEYYKSGIVKKDFLASLIEIEGTNRSGNDVKYRGSAKIDLEKIHKINPLATASSYMVSVLPSILIDRLKRNKINKTGVIAPAALENPLEIVNEASSFKIEFNDEVEK